MNKALLPSVSKTTITTYCFVQLVSFLPFYCFMSGNNHLTNSFSIINNEINFR